MPRKTKDVTANLLRKGFRQRDGGDKYYHLYVGGKKAAVFTFVSHGGREIDDNPLGQMAKQTKLPKNRFLGLVDCPLSEEAYLKLLRDDGHIAGESGSEPAKE